MLRSFPLLFCFPVFYVPLLAVWTRREEIKQEIIELFFFPAAVFRKYRPKTMHPVADCEGAVCTSLGFGENKKLEAETVGRLVFLSRMQKIPLLSQGECNLLLLRRRRRRRRRRGCFCCGFLYLAARPRRKESLLFSEVNAPSSVGSTTARLQIKLAIYRK